AGDTSAPCFRRSCQQYEYCPETRREQSDAPAKAYGRRHQLPRSARRHLVGSRRSVAVQPITQGRSHCPERGLLQRGGVFEVLSALEGFPTDPLSGKACKLEGRAASYG